MTTTALLFKVAETWTLAPFKGDKFAVKGFSSKSEAIAFASSKKWSVKRAPDCDES